MEQQSSRKSAMDHARYLAEMIGPRGPTTPHEAYAAEYAYQVLEEAGLQAVKEAFGSPKSYWRPYALAATVALMAHVLFLFGGVAGAVLASGLMLFALVITLFYLTFRRNPLHQIFSRGQSQNVWAAIPAAGQARRRVLLVGHLDTHRTPKLFSTPLWLRFFKLFIWLNPSAMALSTLIFWASIVWDVGGWRAFSLALALVPWWVSVLAFEADYTPHSVGANDNASGVGVVLSLAARLKQQPLQTSEVWAMCTGAKEVSGYGIADWLAHHASELGPVGRNGKIDQAFCIVVDSVGGQGTTPCYLSKETFLTSAPGDPHLLRLADQVAGRRSDLGARRATADGMYTEARIAASAGLASLAFVNLRQDGSLPHWHQSSDVIANLDNMVIQGTESFVWELLQALDKS